ncbi:hypothetical protein HED60_00655 [Planctomycetales bacterium ZRK34]|nr:hypothetical protein HED60_00655 [Planctomycetales bacterium ZRK34]
MLRWFTHEFDTSSNRQVLVRMATLVDHYFVEVRRVLGPGVSIPIQPPRLVPRRGIALLKRLAQFGIREADAVVWLTEQLGSDLRLAPTVEPAAAPENADHPPRRMAM